MRKRKQLNRLSALQIVKAINGEYAEGQSRIQRQITLLQRMSIADRQGMRYFALSYLLEKVLISCRNSNILHRKYPLHCHADIAAIIRGCYEAAINFLYLFDDEGNYRLAAFWERSIKEEERINNEVEKWTHSSNEIIANTASNEYKAAYRSEEDVKSKIFGLLGVDVDTKYKWPHLQKRAESVGEIWHFFYDARYRSYSTWQHGDTSRMILSPGVVSSLPNLKDRSQTEGILLIGWCYELLHQFALSLNERCGSSDIKKTISIHYEETTKNTQLLLSRYRQLYPSDKQVFDAIE